jgi:hypothetical protein
MYANGTVYIVNDILRHDSHGTPSIYVLNILEVAVRLLNIAKHLYEKTGYQGSLSGQVSIESCKGAKVLRARPVAGYIPFEDPNSALLDAYNWQLELDTLILEDKDKLGEFLVGLGRQMHWDLGVHEDVGSTLKEWVVKRIGA